ncbi:MAG: hypothetical protein FWF82_02255 [Oscillospiraceae bacterium]|nr:hypothetical protein [Oscillospiraceae bacterium]
MKTQKTLWTITGSLLTFALLAFTFILVPVVMAQSPDGGEIETVTAAPVAAEPVVVTTAAEIPTAPTVTTAAQGIEYSLLNESQAMDIEQANDVNLIGTEYAVKKSLEFFRGIYQEVNYTAFSAWLIGSEDPMYNPFYAVRLVLDEDTLLRYHNSDSWFYPGDLWMYIDAITGEEFGICDHPKAECNCGDYVSGLMKDILNEVYPIPEGWVEVDGNLYEMLYESDYNMTDEERQIAVAEKYEEAVRNGDILPNAAQ